MSIQWKIGLGVLAAFALIGALTDDLKKSAPAAPVQRATPVLAAPRPAQKPAPKPAPRPASDEAASRRAGSERVSAEVDLGELTQPKTEYPRGDREAVRALAGLLKRRPDATDVVVRYTNVWPPNPPLARYVHYDRAAGVVYDSNAGGPDRAYQNVSDETLGRLGKLAERKYATVEELETDFGCPARGEESPLVARMRSTGP